MSTVRVKDKDYPIAVTMWALITFKREKGKPVSELDPEDIEGFTYYSWLCVKGACMRDSIPFDVSFEDFQYLVVGDPSEALLVSKIEEQEKKKEKS